MEKRLYLIDGHALVFKMYYAFLRRPMVNSKGEDTSILFGFTKYLLDLIAREKPSHIAVAFDPPGKNFRHELFPDYKGTRAATPQLVIDALEPLVEICGALNIPVLMKSGFEADDVIGTVAKRAEKEEFKVWMVTPDKDYGQLISSNIFQVKPGKSGGDDEILDTAAICARYGISRPEQVIDMLAICGDASDNVPGVDGVGEVGASKLIAKYGSLENIYLNIKEFSTRQQQLFLASQDHIDLSKFLVTIKTDVGIDINFDGMLLDTNYSSKAAELFDHYEFGSLKRFLPARTEKREQKKEDIAFNAENVDEVIRKAGQKGRCAIVLDGDNAFIATEDSCVCRTSVSELKTLLEDEGIAKYGFDLKPLIGHLEEAGISLAGKLMDNALMHYVIDPEKSHKNDMLCRTYLGVELESSARGANTGLLFGDEESQGEAGGKSFEREAVIAMLTGLKIEEELRQSGLFSLYEDMEEPLMHVLSRMERNGVRVDMGSLREYAAELSREVGRLQDSIREMAGEPVLNISSPKQIGAVLYEKLALDPKMKVKVSRNYPTDEETLAKLADKHPIIDEILEFRAAKKLLSTYIEPFPGFINPNTRKIHATFNQALTATGRLSCSKPNLQNIPIRTEQGRKIRKAFVPSSEEGLILSADYSQIELRIMAHLSCDKNLIEAFREGVDVHKMTAAKIFAIPADEVSADQRRIAKTANFGIMYGISSFGLAQRLHISRTEAKKIIDDYFANFPAISMFIEDTAAAARENGYVETLFGRRRYIPDINSANANVRALAQRNAVNAPIQGTSADIIKMAMCRIDREIRNEGLKSRMVLQIHDELVFDTIPQEVDRLREIVVRQMENVTKLSVPLTVECNYGKNWLEAH